MRLVTLYNLIALIAFTIYNIYILAVFGVPENLSTTYYLLEHKHRGCGWMCPALMLLLCLTILPLWLEVNSKPSPHPHREIHEQP